jgi:hypothetical protein
VSKSYRNNLSNARVDFTAGRFRRPMARFWLCSRTSTRSSSWPTPIEMAKPVCRPITGEESCRTSPNHWVRLGWVVVCNRGTVPLPYPEFDLGICWINVGFSAVLGIGKRQYASTRVASCNFLPLVHCYCDALIGQLSETRKRRGGSANSTAPVL